MFIITSPINVRETLCQLPRIYSADVVEKVNAQVVIRSETETQNNAHNQQTPCASSAFCTHIVPVVEHCNDILRQVMIRKTVRVSYFFPFLQILKWCVLIFGAYYYYY